MFGWCKRWGWKGQNVNIFHILDQANSQHKIFWGSKYFDFKPSNSILFGTAQNDKICLKFWGKWPPCNPWLRIWIRLCSTNSFATFLLYIFDLWRIACSRPWPTLGVLFQCTYHENHLHSYVCKSDVSSVYVSWSKYVFTLAHVWCTLLDLREFWPLRFDFGDDAVSSGGQSGFHTSIACTLRFLTAFFSNTVL